MKFFLSALILLGSFLGLSSGSATSPEGCPKCECPATTAPEGRSGGSGGGDDMMARSLGHLPIEYESYDTNPDFQKMEEMTRMFTFMLATANPGSEFQDDVEAIHPLDDESGASSSYSSSKRSRRSAPSYFYDTGKPNKNLLKNNLFFQTKKLWEKQLEYFPALRYTPGKFGFYRSPYQSHRNDGYPRRPYGNPRRHYGYPSHQYGPPAPHYNAW